MTTTTKAALCRGCRQPVNPKTDVVRIGDTVRFLCGDCRALRKHTRAEAFRWAPVARALLTYDRAWRRFERLLGTTTIEECMRALDATDRSLLLIQEAFYQATKDVNCRDKAALIRPDGQNAWLSKLLAGYGLYHGTTKAERRSRGWGW